MTTIIGGEKQFYKKNSHNQRGIALTEFVIIGPLVLFIGLVGIQYGLIYNARLNVTYAGYEAARAGAMYNADPAKIQDAFFKGLVPYFATTGIYLPGNVHIPSPIGAGRGNPANGTPMNPTPLEVGAEGYLLKEIIKKSEAAFVDIHMINPSKASFVDWNSPDLQKFYMIKTGQNLNGRRIIPNSDLDTRPTTVGKKSLQSIQDANVLKLRITYGYEPRIPMMGKLFSSVLAYIGGERDATAGRILAAGRVPITVDVASQMLSPPIETGLPTTTVNRNGFLIGTGLADALIGNQAMQWQVGQDDPSALSVLGNQVVDSANAAINNSSVAGGTTTQQLGNLVLGAGKQVLKDVWNGADPTNAVKLSVSAVTGAVQTAVKDIFTTGSPTGHASSNTTSLIGDMNGLVSCSDMTPVTNFY